MIRQLEDFDNETLAIEVIEAFDSDDRRELEKLLKDKLEEGFKVVNLLIKIDEIFIEDKDQLEAFYNDFVYDIRDYNNIGRIAFVGNSDYLKSLVNAENLFYHQWEKSYMENYYESDELAKAYDFVLEPSLTVKLTTVKRSNK